MILTELFTDDNDNKFVMHKCTRGESLVIVPIQLSFMNAIVLSGVLTVTGGGNSYTMKKGDRFANLKRFRDAMGTYMGDVKITSIEETYFITTPYQAKIKHSQVQKDNYIKVEENSFLINPNISSFKINNTPLTKPFYKVKTHNSVTAIEDSYIFSVSL